MAARFGVRAAWPSVTTQSILKTIIPSRKATRDYMDTDEPDEKT
jgi:hypothetical protein